MFDYIQKILEIIQELWNNNNEIILSIIIGLLTIVSTVKKIRKRKEKYMNEYKITNEEHELILIIRKLIKQYEKNINNDMEIITKTDDQENINNNNIIDNKIDKLQKIKDNKENISLKELMEILSEEE